MGLHIHPPSGLLVKTIVDNKCKTSHIWRAQDIALTSSNLSVLRRSSKRSPGNWGHAIHIPKTPLLSGSPAANPLPVEVATPPRRSLDASPPNSAGLCNPDWHSLLPCLANLATVFMTYGGCDKAVAIALQMSPPQSKKKDSSTVPRQMCSD